MADAAGRESTRQGFGVDPQGSNESVPIIFVHGQPGSSSSWMQVVSRIEGSRECVVYDRPGWGSSPGDAEGIFRNAVHLLRLLDRNHTPRYHLVGHSFGSAIAVVASNAAPERVASLTLVAPACSTDALVLLDHLINVPLLGRVATSLGLRAYERVSSGASFGYRTRRSFLLEQAWMLKELPEVERILADVRSRTLVIGARDDRIVPTRAVATVHRRIKGSVLELLPRGGHSLPMTRPSDVARLVLALTRP